MLWNMNEHELFFNNVYNVMTTFKESGFLHIFLYHSASSPVTY